MKVKAIFDGDTKRYHRYVIDDKQVKGTLYFAKNSTIPDTVQVEIADSTRDDSEEQ